MKVKAMENLGDILNRMRENRSINGDAADSGNGSVPPEEPEEDACPVCEGRLWLAVDAPVGHPDFGKLEPCQCQAKIDLSERASRLRRYSNLGPLTRLTFESADREGVAIDPEGKRLYRIAYEAALEYANRPIGWLVLTGPNGSGKTHLAAAITNRCIDQGLPVFFVHVPDLLDDLRSTYSPLSELSYSELFEQVNQAPLLVLDGLGTQSPTPWAQEKLQQIFNQRANSELPTVVTTASQISDIDPYIASRMIRPTLSRLLEVPGSRHDSSKRLGIVPPEMLEQMTFDTFDTRGNGAILAQRNSLERAFESARVWASEPRGWLTLFGETGAGKTHLAVAIANVRLSLGYPVFFTFVPDLMDYLRSTFRPSSEVAYDRVFNEVRDAPLLILDDWGGERRSDWADEKLYQIVVHRHNLTLPTIITTRTKVSEASGPIASRMRDPATGLQRPIDAPDYRNRHRRTGNRLDARDQGSWRNDRR